MRIARDFGDVSQVLPDGVTLRDAPYQIFDAIRQALVFIGFQDLPKDEQPPKSIWHDPDAIRQHFKDVEKQREDKYKGKDAIDDPVQNPAAKGLLIGG